MRVRLTPVAALIVCLAVLTACGSGSHRPFTSDTQTPSTTSPTNPTPPGGGTTDPGQTQGGGTNNPGQTPGGGTTNPTEPSGGGTAATLTSIRVSPGSLSLSSGSTTQFSATGTYSDGSTQDITASVTWSSSNTSAATVTGAGLVTALGPGQATITATSGTAAPGSGTVSTVPSALSIGVPSATLALGQSQQLAAVATYTDGPHDVTASVTWSSSDTNIVTVSAAGVAAAVATGGPVTITAALGSLTASGSISVGPAVLTQITIAPAPGYASYCRTSSPPVGCSIATHQILQLQATGVYSDGHNLDVTAEATWSVDTDHSANMHFLSAGTAFGDSTTTAPATVTATLNGVNGTATVAITSATVTSAGVTIAPDAWTLPQLATKQFTASALWSDGSAQDITSNPMATWTSDNTSVAIVGPSSANTRLGHGMAQGLTAGSANISVGIDGESASAVLTVTPAHLTTITITPASASIPMTMVQQFTAMGSFADSTVSPAQTTQVDITDAVTWTATDTSIASIASGGAHSGVAVPLHVGQTAIVAALPGSPAVVSAPATLNVTGSQLTEVVVTPVSPKVGMGAGVQFAATAKFDDGSVYDLTNYFNWSGLNPWSSSNATVASISNRGYASTLGSGTTTISAAVAGVTGSSLLTVTAAQLRSVIILPSTQSPTSVSFDSATGLPIQPTLGMTQHSRIQLKAYGYYTDQTFQTLTGVIWSTPPPRNIVVVTSSGLVVAKPHSAGGTVTITATIPGSTITGSASLVVAGTIDSKLQLLWNGSPIPAQVAAGTGLQFSAWAMSGGTPVQDVTSSVQWSTSDPGCAVISSTGFATGKALPCTVQIVATYDKQGTVASSWTLFTVTGATLSSISIAPSNPSLPNPPVIALGASQQLTATGTFSDSTTQDLTDQVSWTSSDVGVVVMSNSARGLAVSSGAGSATVSATLGSNAPGTALVTVTAPPAQ